MRKTTQGLTLFLVRVFEGNDRDKQVPDKLEFLTGESMKAETNYWVGIYNGEKPPKLIVDVHGQKLSVKVQVSVSYNTSSFIDYSV